MQPWYSFVLSLLVILLGCLFSLLFQIIYLGYIPGGTGSALFSSLSSSVLFCALISVSSFFSFSLKNVSVNEGSVCLESEHRPAVTILIKHTQKSSVVCIKELSLFIYSFSCSLITYFLDNKCVPGVSRS